MAFDVDDQRAERGLGGTSARAWLLTVLGEYVLPTGGLVWTAALLDALRLLGVEEKAARQAIARSAERGWLQSERVGRRVRWQLTEAADKLLREGTERIYSFHVDQPSWDGRWLLVLVSIPETRRDLRYRMRLRLGWAGFAPIGTGAWLSPWTDREEEAYRVLSDLDVAGSARSFVGGLGMMGDARALLAEAWDLEGIGARYGDFIARHRDHRADAPAEAFVVVTKLVHEWRRFPTVDPDLPTALLPQPWMGHEAARLFHEVHGRHGRLARAWWDDRSPL